MQRWPEKRLKEANKRLLIIILDWKMQLIFVFFKSYGSLRVFAIADPSLSAHFWWVPKAYNVHINPEFTHAKEKANGASQVFRFAVAPSSLAILLARSTME